VRGILAGLLAEKGIPPQEVKSLLEGISLEQAKSLVKPRAEVTDGTARQEAANLVGQSRNPKGERWDVRESRAGTPEVIGQKASEGARAPSEEAPAEKAQPAKAESRSYHELLQDKRAELKRPEGPGGSPHPMSGSAGEKFLVSTQEAGKTGIPVTDGSRQSEPYRETLSSLSDRMSWMVQSGIHKARILLSPPDLGRIEVELALERGHLRAQIGAESVAAKEMIDAHLNPLRQQLAELGFSGAEFEVHVGLNDRWNEGRDPLWASWEQARPAPREKTEASELTPETGATGPGETLPQYQISLRV
jgi:flagellar hook-length control protein FliK